MKKIFSLILAAVILALSLASCAGGSGNTKNTGPAETTANENLPDYAGQKISDYDSNGNFILTSGTDRVVYTYESGYVVFTFLGSAVQKIQQVLVFEDEAAAGKYVTDIALEAIDKGEIPPTLRANKNLVIVPVSISNDKKDLGYYYTQSRNIVEAAFAAEGDEQ